MTQRRRGNGERRSRGTLAYGTSRDVVEEDEAEMGGRSERGFPP